MYIHIYIYIYIFYTLKEHLIIQLLLGFLEYMRFMNVYQCKLYLDSATVFVSPHIIIMFPKTECQHYQKNNEKKKKTLVKNTWMKYVNEKLETVIDCLFCTVFHQIIWS